MNGMGMNGMPQQGMPGQAPYGQPGEPGEGGIIRTGALHPEKLCDSDDEGARADFPLSPELLSPSPEKIPGQIVPAVCDRGADEECIPDVRADNRAGEKNSKSGWL